MGFATQGVRAGLLLLGAVGAASASIADDVAAKRENQLKAAYLFNFMKFVEWPASAASDTIEICFVGAQGVHDSLETTTADKRVGDRRVVVRTLIDGAQGEPCAVIYFDENASHTNSALLQSARATALTVSDARDFTRSGGVIRLFTDQNKLRFVVNVENAKRAGLRISSNLLKLASSVEQESAP
ncbi:MAG: YfiR family protein [Steroidobacter sp.]